VSWLFVQGTGGIYKDDNDGKFIHEGDGYSGHGLGKNAPIMDSVPGIGPIPCGFYIIGKPEDHMETMGPFCLPLIPDQSNQMYGRSGFFWHGDSLKAPGMASHGCIISNRILRNMVYTSNDSLLRVVKEFNNEAS
jgi:hypothetical protein